MNDIPTPTIRNPKPSTDATQEEHHVTQHDEHHEADQTAAGADTPSPAGAQDQGGLTTLVGDTELAPDATAQPDTDAPDSPEADKHEDDPSGNKEAAKYRRRLREAEAALEAANARAEAAQRTTVETIAAKSIREPVALWMAGVKLPELLDDNGEVDRAKVAEAVERTAHTLGIPRAPRPDPNQGRSFDSTPAGFADAFRPR